MIEVHDRDVAKRATAPPKRWRNRFRCILTDSLWFGQPCGDGEIVFGSKVWPSAEVAESTALACKDRRDAWGNTWSSHCFEYLGPCPVDKAL